MSTFIRINHVYGLLFLVRLNDVGYYKNDFVLISWVVVEEMKENKN